MSRLLSKKLAEALRQVRSMALSVVLVGSAALSVGACGEDEPPDRVLRVDAAADGALRFERSAVRTTAGPVAIEMANPSDIPHAIGIRGNGINATGETVGRDRISRVQTELEPGDYRLFCPVAGHEQAGMTATLTVG